MAGKNTSKQEISLNGDRKLEGKMGRERELRLGMEGCLVAVQLQHCQSHPRLYDASGQCHLFASCKVFGAAQACWRENTDEFKHSSLKSEEKCGRWMLPAATAFTLGTWDVPELHQGFRVRAHDNSNSCWQQGWQPPWHSLPPSQHPGRRAVPWRAAMQLQWSTTPVI